VSSEVWSTGVACEVLWLASEVWMVFMMWQNAVMVCWLYAYMSCFMYRIEPDWVGICRSVRRGYMGVVLKGGGVQEECVGGCGWAGV
jgi:hypothetical protein